MIKVFLVEDEVVIRNGIKKGINWEQEGFIFTGEASDGEVAYPLIKKARPDILITDIKMPFMNGLELSRMLKKEFPDMKILILSGYNEFDYAKQAITIGVTDYLLKPISAEQLLEEIKKVAVTIQKEREERELLKKYEENMQENLEYEKYEFLTRILAHRLSVTETLEEGKRLDMDLSAPLYNMILLKVSSTSDGKEVQEQLIEVYSDVEKYLEEQNGIYYFRRGIEGWVLLCLSETEEQMNRKIELLERGIKEIIDAYSSKIEYFGGIGTPISRLRDLKESFSEAERVFAYRYLKEWNQMIGCKEFSEGAAAIKEDETLNLKTLSVDNLDRKVTEGFLKTGLKGEVTHFVDDYFESLGKNNVQSLLFRQYVTMDVYLSAVTMLEQLGYGSEELVKRCGDFQTMEAVFATVDKTKEYLKEVLEAAINLREAVSKQKYNTLLADAKSYIEKNYDNESISLNTVAASVNLSPSHFSTIFSQEMGQTFIEFLTQVRMEKAKELLRTSSMKTTEIAFAVGYKDSHYFSYLFKKTQKCTPREFRSQV